MSATYRRRIPPRQVFAARGCRQKDLGNPNSSDRMLALDDYALSSSWALLTSTDDRGERDSARGAVASEHRRKKVRTRRSPNGNRFVPEAMLPLPSTGNEHRISHRDP